LYPSVGLVRTGQQQIAAKDPYAWFVSTGGLSKLRDRVHYDLPGQLELGQRFARAYLDAVGSTPD
jgi:hypothetical protein